MAFDPTTAVLADEGKFDPTTATLSVQDTASSDTETKKQVNRFDYIANQAKLGLVDTAVLGQALIDTFVTDPFKIAYAAATGKEGPKGGIGQRFTGNIQRLQKAGAQITGADTEMKAPDTLTAIFGSGARTAADPLGFVGAPAKVLPVVGRTAGLFTAGSTAEVGGIVGEGAEKAITGEDTGLGRAIGSITAVIKGAPLAAGAQEAVASSASVVKQINDKYKMFKENPDAANQAYASGAAKRVLQLMAKEKPTENIDEIVTEFNRISNSINKENLPLFVAMADNPVVQFQVSSLAKTNPEFRQRVELELANLAKSIDQRSDTLFGQRYTPVLGAEGVSVKNAIKRRENIDTKIQDFGAKLDTGVDEATLGKAISNLVEAREKTARAEMAPVYQNILADAKRSGAKLPEEGVQTIYNFIKSNRIRDVFGRGTPLDNAIMSNFGPKDGEFFPVNFDTVDSLKRRINEIQRKPLSPTEARLIQDLEDVFTTARNQIPGNFSDRLKDADRMYYEKIGVPFSAQGIREIDSKKYAELVAPVVIKNASSTSQFIDAVGRESAAPVIRNALFAEAYKNSVKDGVFDPIKLRRYIDKKSNVLNRVPEVKQELESAVLDTGKLQLERKALDNAVRSAENDIASNFVLGVKDSQGVSVPNYRELSTRLFRDTTFFQKIKKDISQLDPATSKAVKNNIRAEIVDIAQSSDKGAITFLTDKKNAKVINEVFGPGYVGALQDLLKLSDAVKLAKNIDNITAQVGRSELDGLARKLSAVGIPGLDAPFVFSTLRDRISSIPQKAIRLLSRVNTAQLDQATQEAIKDLLTDPNGLKKLQAAAKEMDFSINNPVSVRNYINRLTDILPQYAYAGAKVATQPGFEPEVEETLMGGFEEE